MYIQRSFQKKANSYKAYRYRSRFEYESECSCSFVRCNPHDVNECVEKPILFTTGSIWVFRHLLLNLYVHRLD